MIESIVHFLGVSLALWFIFGLIPLPAAKRIDSQGNWIDVLFLSIVFGLTSQCILGLIWNHVIGRAPLFEVFVYLGIWIFIPLVYRKQRSCPLENRRRSEIITPPLAAILLVAVVVRTLHPLQVMALSQSDAYSHLHFVRYILEYGGISGSFYPPGYHWVMAAPSLLFGLDPYVVMRFGGVFFGVGLVLASYVLMRQEAGPRAALWTSLLLSAFPGLNVLLKTGVGAFANQIGIFFIPVALAYYMRVKRQPTPFALSRDGLLLMAALSGLAASVPMMLLHVLLILSLDLAISAAGAPGTGLRSMWRGGAHLLPALCIVAFHIIINPVFEGTIQGLTAAEKPHRGILSAIVAMINDYGAFKRWGVGDPWLNTMGLACLGLFAACWFTGWRRRDHGMLLLGIWGSVTGLQTMTGLLQFSAYQREGWSMLIAVGCLAGAIADGLYRRFRAWRIIRIGATVLALVVVVPGVWRPPVHRQINSSAEDEVVRLARFTARWKADPSIPVSGVHDEIFRHLDPKRPITLVARSFGGWKGGRGDILPAVLPSGIDVQATIVHPKTAGGSLFERHRQYIVLLDREIQLTPKDLGPFAGVSEALARGFINGQQYLLQANRRIQQSVDSLSGQEWRIEPVRLSPFLAAIVVVPKY